MSYPTAGEVCEQARGVLADQDVVGGDIYTDEKLLPHVKNALRDVWRSLQNIQAPLIVRVRYAILRANTVSLDIKGAVALMSTVFADMKEPIAIYERSGLTEHTITATSVVTNGVQLTTSAAHGRATGDRVTVQGLINSGSAQMGGEGMYGITVVDTTNFTANGMYMRTGGTYSSGGVAVYSANRFLPMRKVGRIEDQTANRSDLNRWAWGEDRLLFAGVDTDRQLAIVYESGATVPDDTSDVIAVKDSIDVLAVLTAAYATRIRMPTVHDLLMNDALGRARERDGSGGMLRDLVLPILKASQLDRDKQRPPIEFVNEYLSYALRQ